MKCCLLVFLSFIYYAVSAQVNIKISGKVQSTEGVFLANSSVLIYHADKLSASNFTFTNEEGFYSTSVIAAKGGLRLVFSHLGYEEKEVGLNYEIFYDTTLYFNITLNSKNTLLDSVIITSPKAITVKGDTTIFNAQSFGSKIENKVEDLLKNLPGMQVDEDGNLRFNNKPISKVTINGIDLFSDDYKKLTKNLSAGYLDAVEVIENYSDNPVLKDFDFNKRSVINLKLNKSLLKVFGEAQAAYDPFKNHEDLNGNLFSLIGKLKLAAIANYNNIGNNLATTGLNKQSLEDLLNPNSIEIPYNHVSNLITPVNAPGIDKKRYFLNNDKKYSLNFATKILKTIETKGDISISNLNNRQATEQSSLFLLSDPPLNIYERKNLQNDIKQTILNTRLTYTKSDKLKVDYKAKYFQNKTYSSSNLEVIPQNDNLQQNNLKDNFFNSMLRVTKKLGFQKVGELEAVFQKNKTPSFFEITPLSFESFLGLPLVNKLNYKEEQHLNYLAIKPKYFLKKVNEKSEKELQLNLFYESARQSQVIQFNGITNTDEKLPAKTPFQSDEYINTKTKSVELKYTIKEKKFEWFLNPSLSYVDYYFSNQLSANKNSEIKSLIYHNIFSLKRKLNQSRSLEIKLENGSSIPQAFDLFTGYKLLDYRTFSKFDYDTSMVKGYSNRLQFLYNNVEIAKGKMLLVNLAYNKGQNNFITNYIYNPIYTIQERHFNANTSNTLNGFLLYEKTIPAIYARLSTNLFMFYFRRKTEITSGSIYQNSFSVDQEINLKTALKNPYNFKAAFLYSYNNQFSPIANTSTFQYKINLESSLNAIHKRLLSKMLYQFIDYNKNGRGLHFIDLGSQYQPGKKNFIVTFQLLNLLNNKKFTATYLNPELKIDKTILLQTRQCLIGVIYRF